MAATAEISYADLYARWERGNWSATEIDFAQDRIDWQEKFTPQMRRGALWLYTLFFHGEDAVADGLSPYIDAASMGRMYSMLSMSKSVRSFTSSPAGRMGTSSSISVTPTHLLGSNDASIGVGARSLKSVPPPPPGADIETPRAAMHTSRRACGFPGYGISRTTSPGIARTMSPMWRAPPCLRSMSARVITLDARLRARE